MRRDIGADLDMSLILPYAGRGTGVTECRKDK
jgi:hypothetical protein